MTNYNYSQSNKKIKFGAVVSYIVITINILSGFLFTPWLVRRLGQSNYGLYTLALSLINLFLIDFGISASISRFIAKYEAENNQGKVHAFISLIVKLYIIIDIFVAIGLLLVGLFLDRIYVSLTPLELQSFREIFIICAVYNVINFPLTTLSNGFLNAYEYFGIQKIASVSGKIGQVVFSIIALSLGGNLTSVVVVNALCTLITTITKIILVRVKTPIRIKILPFDKQLANSVFSFTIWTAISGIAERMTYNIEPSILGVLSSTSAIAVFGAASALESYIYTVTTGINGLFLPRISRILAADDSNALIRLMIRVGKIQYVITGLIFVGFISIGRFFLTLWMGPDYIDAYLCTILMVAPCLLTRPQQIGNTTLIAKGNVKELAIVDLGTITINLVVSVVLAKSFGAVGVAVGICAGNIFGGVARCYLYKKIIHVDISLFITECYIKIGIPILVMTFIGWIVDKFVKMDKWSLLFIVGIIVVIMYSLFIWIFSLSTDQRKYIIDKVKPHIKK